MVAVPLRAAPLDEAMVTPTTPLPAPDGTLTEIQLALLAAFHGQPGPAVTATAVDSPAFDAANVPGEIANEQPSD